MELHFIVKLEVWADRFHHLCEFGIVVDSFSIIDWSILGAVAVIAVEDSWDNRLSNNSLTFVIYEACVENTESRDIEFVQNSEIS